MCCCSLKKYLLCHKDKINKSIIEICDKSFIIEIEIESRIYRMNPSNQLL